MVGPPAWGAGAAALRRLRVGGIDAGLHLDFTEHPLAPSMRHGLWPLIGAAYRAYGARLDHDALRAEIRAQLDAFEDGLGRAPDFVDGHQHVHQLPAVRGELIDELVRRYGTRGPWLRRTRCRFAASAVAGTSALMKSAVIEALGAGALEAAARRAGLAQNQALLGVYDFNGGATHYRRLMRAWLRAARDGDLLMCHPADGCPPDDALAAAREAEFKVLSNDGFVRWLNDAGVELRPMSGILGQRR